MKKPDGLYLPIHNIATLILAKNLLYSFNIYYGHYSSKGKSNQQFLRIKEEIEKNRTPHQSSEFKGLLVRFYYKRPSVVAIYEFEYEIIKKEIEEGRFLHVHSINELFNALSSSRNPTTIELPTIVN